jgi:serine/threonine protein kinase
MIDFTHTTDGEANLRHRRKIGAGGYGVVHEVLSDYEKMLTPVKLYDIPTGKVFLLI